MSEMGARSIIKILWPTLAPGEEAEFLSLVEQAVMDLPQRDGDIVKRRHGFTGTKEKLAELAPAFKVSIPAISQIEKKSLEKIKAQVDRARKGPISAENLTLEDLDLSVRTKRLLASAGIASIFDLCSKPPEFYMSLPGFGKGCFTNIKDELAKYNLSLTQSA